MPTCMSPQFEKLTYLQHLSIYVVSKESSCGIGELKSLRGSLCIKDIDVSNSSEAREAKLCLKTCLDKLELEWTSRGGQSPQLLSEEKREQAEVLANLQPHKSLKELVNQNYCGVVYPVWLSDPSHHLQAFTCKG